MPLARRNALKGLIGGAGAAMAVARTSTAGGWLQADEAVLEIRYTGLCTHAYDTAAKRPSLGVSAVMLADTDTETASYGKHIPELLVHGDHLASGKGESTDAAGNHIWKLKNKQLRLQLDGARADRPVQCLSHIHRPIEQEKPVWKLDKCLLETDPHDIVWVPDLQQIFRSSTTVSTSGITCKTTRAFVDGTPNVANVLGGRVLLANGTIGGDQPHMPSAKHLRFGFSADAQYEQPLVDALRYRSMPARLIELVLENYDGSNPLVIEVWPASGSIAPIVVRNEMDGTGHGNKEHFEVHYRYATGVQLKPVYTRKWVCGTTCEITTGCDYPIFCPPARIGY
jgi:hypothetical protein